MTGATQTQTKEVLDQLLPVWREMLGSADASPDENFFEAGGTSLLAARIASRLTLVLGLRVTAADLLAHPSASKLAQKLSGGTASLDRTGTNDRAAMQRNAFSGSRPTGVPGRNPVRTVR